MQSLDDWLAWQLAAHPTEIELGLYRVAAVADRLSLRATPARAVLVAGTNGKGSTVALLEGLVGCRARVGSYTSPHLWRYNERIRIDGVAVADADIVAAFEAIAAVRDDTPLTFFEWGTLAALWLFKRAGVDLMLLEVGLGGRLDAVNIIDADIAIVTTIGLDHTAWLGDTREAIGYEKAGIFRTGRQAFCADRDMPASIAAHAAAIGTPLARISAAFDLGPASETPEAAAQPMRWHFRDRGGELDMPVLPGVHPDNLAAALAGVRALGFAVAPGDIERAAEAQAHLPARRETIDGAIPIVYDVGHNEQAVALLVATLEHQPVTGDTHVVIGMLADKPAAAVAACLSRVANHWYPAGLDSITARGLSAAAMADVLGVAAPGFADPAGAFVEARRQACPGDRIVVCGSFYTVAQARSPE